MPRAFLYAGSWPRTYQSDLADTAFGIYGFSQQESGSSFVPSALQETPAPGWIAIHPNRRFLYAVNEIKKIQGANGGGVSAFAVDPNTGVLSRLNSRCTETLPCHCAVDATGRFLVVACYGGGTVNLFSVESNGQIGPECDVQQHSGSSVHPERQSKPHPHSVTLDPANCFLFVPDLGLDQILVYKLDRDAGKLVPRLLQTVKVTPGSGPRHIVFDSHGRFAYLINEINTTITAFAYESSVGALQELQTIDLLPRGFEGYRSGAAIAIHPSGMFVYATTRSHGSKGMPALPGMDSIVWCAIHQQDGMLGEPSRVLSGGVIPRSFAFDLEGKYLYVAHQGDSTIITFTVNPHTGEPILIGDAIRTPNPVCVCLL